MRWLSAWTYWLLDTNAITCGGREGERGREGGREGGGERERGT